MDQDIFAEIEYEASSTPLEKQGSVRAAQSIGVNEPDPIRQKFYDMRELAPNNPLTWNDDSLFYKQAKFMEDFTDDYEEIAEFKMYNPVYQRMGYEKLRTYFTWRTRVRNGEILPIGLSYIYLYIYELISCVGVKSPEDGLNKLYDLWQTLRKTEPDLDAHVPGWIKDFFVYYDMPYSFKDFVSNKNLFMFYSENFLFDTTLPCCLYIWNGASSYNVMKSQYFNSSEEAKKNLLKCFPFVLNKVDEFLESHNLSIQKLMFDGKRVRHLWIPFKKAVFHQWKQFDNREVEFPCGKKYRLTDKRIETSYDFPSKHFKDFVHFFIRMTEIWLRRQTGFKKELNMITSKLLFLDTVTLHGLKPSTFIEFIEKAVKEFLKEKNRVVVNVDVKNLNRIREESLDTTEKLVVKEEDTGINNKLIFSNEIKVANEVPKVREVNSIWHDFDESLTEIEKEALIIIMSGDPDLKTFASSKNIMLEVLMDNINEKAMDTVGDNILSEDFEVYDEYKNSITLDYH